VYDSDHCRGVTVCVRYEQSDEDSRASKLRRKALEAMKKKKDKTEPENTAE
jgi:hypothetical protein